MSWKDRAQPVTESDWKQRAKPAGDWRARAMPADTSGGVNTDRAARRAATIQSDAKAVAGFLTKPYINPIGWAANELSEAKFGVPVVEQAYRGAYTGLGDFGGGVASLATRALPGESTLGREFNQTRDLSMQQNEEEAGTVGRLSAGAVASIAPAFSAGQLGGMPAVIAYFAQDAYGQAYDQALQSGMSQDNANAFAQRAGAIEGALTFIGGRIARALGGSAGIESVGLSLGKQTLIQMAKSLGMEVTEEMAIEFANAVNEDLSGVVPGALSQEQLVARLKETALQTIVTMGGVEASQTVMRSAAPQVQQPTIEQRFIQGAEQQQELGDPTSDSLSPDDVFGPVFQRGREADDAKARQVLYDKAVAAGVPPKLAQQQIDDLAKSIDYPATQNPRLERVVNSTADQRARQALAERQRQAEPQPDTLYPEGPQSELDRLEMAARRNVPVVPQPAPVVEQESADDLRRQQRRENTQLPFVPEREPGYNTPSVQRGGLRPSDIFNQENTPNAQTPTPSNQVTQAGIPDEQGGQGEAERVDGQGGGAVDTGEGEAGGVTRAAVSLLDDYNHPITSANNKTLMSTARSVGVSPAVLAEEVRRVRKIRRERTDGRRGSNKKPVDTGRRVKLEAMLRETSRQERAALRSFGVTDVDDIAAANLSDVAITYAAEQLKALGATGNFAGKWGSWYGTMPSGRTVRIADHQAKDGGDTDISIQYPGDTNINDWRDIIEQEAEVELKTAATEGDSRASRGTEPKPAEATGLSNPASRRADTDRTAQGSQPSTPTATQQNTQETGNEGAGSVEQGTPITNRFRPSDAITFDNPPTGPTGVQMLGYQWQYRFEDDVDARGEDITRRVSDWDKADVNIETGRDIVHQFIVRMKDGNERVVSLESALELMGYIEPQSGKPIRSLASTVKTIARHKMALQQLKAEQRAYRNALQSVDMTAMPSPVREETDAIGRDAKARGDKVVWWTAGDARVRDPKQSQSISRERLGALQDAWKQKRLTERGWSVGAGEVLASRIDTIEAQLRRAEKRLTSTQQNTPTQETPNVRKEEVRQEEAATEEVETTLPETGSQVSEMSLLDAIAERPKSRAKENQLRQEFGDDVVDAARDSGLIVGESGYNSPLSLTIKGRERFGKRPSDYRIATKRGRDYVVALVDITGKTYKPEYAKGKEVQVGGRYAVEVEVPINKWGRFAASKTVYRDATHMKSAAAQNTQQTSSEMSYRELQAEAKRLGVKANGTKAELAQRVAANRRNSGFVNVEILADTVDAALKAGKWTADTTRAAANYVVNTAKRAVKSVADVARTLVKRFGEAVRKHAPRVWAEIKKVHADETGAIKLRMPRRTPPKASEAKATPKPVKPQKPVSEPSALRTGAKEAAKKAGGDVGGILARFPQWYSEDMIDRLVTKAKRATGKSIAGMEKAFRQVVDAQKAYAGRLNPNFDRISRFGSIKNYRKYRGAIRELQENVSGDDAVIVTALQAALEPKVGKKYGTPELSPEAKEIVDALRGTHLETAKILEELELLNDDGNLFRGTEGGNVRVRVATEHLHNALQLGEGSATFTALVKALAKLNGMSEKQVQGLLTKIRNEMVDATKAGQPASEQSRKIGPEFNRYFDIVPDALYVNGKEVELYQSNPIAYGKRLIQLVSMRAGVVKELGQDEQLTDYYRRAAADAGINADMFNETLRTLNGYPVEFSRFDPSDNVYELMRVARGLGSVIRAGLISMSAIPNIGEFAGNVPAFMGYKQLLGHVKRMTTDKEARANLEALGGFIADVSDVSYDPRRPVSSRLRQMSEVLRILNRPINELQERVSADAGNAMAKRLKDGKGSVEDWVTLRAMGFDSDTALAMYRGEYDGDYNQITRRAPAFLTGGNLTGAESSRAAHSRIFKRLWAFQMYPQMKMRSFIGLIKAWQAASEANAPAGAKRAALTKTTKYLAGTTASGGISYLLLALATGGMEGLKQALGEAQDDPVDFMVDSFAYSMLGGPIGQLWRIMSEDSNSIGEDAIRSTFPGFLTLELVDAAKGTGSYRNHEPMERGTKLIKRLFPINRFGATLAATVGIGEEAHKLNVDMRAYYRWARDKDVVKGRFIGETTDFGIQMRKATEAMKKGEDPTPFILAAIQTDGKTPNAIKQSLRSRRLLSKLKPDQLESLRQRVGNDAYTRLRNYDALLEAWANAL
jgi:chaperonin cofactor prefoldin